MAQYTMNNTLLEYKEIISVRQSKWWKIENKEKKIWNISWQAVMLLGQVYLGTLWSSFNLETLTKITTIKTLITWNP